MARLNWGVVAERFFETGVDRGVLYTGDGIGVPWNGLTSVSEAPTGGEPKPAYIDGRKFRNIASSEEFEATIEAFAAPKEFGPCDGSRSIQNGLIATQQPRQAFSFSYRTLIGNPIEGTELGYKIHLVYNALAGPASRSNGTIGDSTEASKLNWAVTTLPPSLTGYKPTAHFVIDSTQTPDGLLLAIEEILYGNDVNSARMPLVSELVAMFQSQGPQLRMNYAMVPSFRATSGSAEIRRNLHPNPFVISTIAAAEVRRNYIADPRLTTATGWVGVAAGGLTTQAQTYSPNQTAAAGETWMVAADITAPAGAAAVGSISVGATTAASFGTNARGNTNFNIPAGTTQRIYNVFTLAAGADGLRVLFGNTTPTSGVKIDKVSMEKQSTNLPYFDGATAAALGLTYSWTGTANASASIATGLPAIGFTANSQNYVSTVNGRNWTQMLNGTFLYAQSTGVVGKYYAAKCRIAGPPGTVFNFASTDNLVGAWLGTLPNFTIPAEGEIVCSIPSGPANGNAAAGALMFGPSGASAKLLRMTDVLVEEVPGTGLYIQDGDVFSGATAAGDGLVYSWTGTVNNSPSIATGQLPVGAVKAGNSTDVNLWQGLDGSDKTVHIQIKKAVAGQGFYLSPSYVHGLAAGLWLPGDQYVSSIWVKGTEGVQVNIETAATGSVGGFNPKIVHTFSGEWERVWISATFPAGAASSGPYMLIRSVNASYFDMQAKLIQIEDGVNPTDNFDGSTVDDDGYFYSWIGAPDITASIINSWHLS